MIEYFFEEYLDLLDTFRRKQLSKTVVKIKEGILSAVNGDKFNPKLQAYLRDMNQVGEPFTEFADEPAQVSQIKKIINTLYHLELALKDLEKVNLRNGSSKTQDLSTLWNHTLHHIYQAGFYLTHMDVDVKEVFSEELAALTPVLQSFYSYTAVLTKEKDELFHQLESANIPHKVGVIAGIGVDQMQPNGGHGTMDYEFLTQFTAVIPKHLDKLTQYIQSFSSTMAEREPNVDKRTLDALQNEALQLLHSLEKAQGNNFLMPLKVIQYIRVVRHATTLMLSIMDQIKNVGTSSQEVIRENLAKLKYEVLPELYGLVDKIEEQSMVKPGTLVGPLHEQTEKLYKELIKYAENVVDFSKKGQELTTINDGTFMRRRLEFTYKRMAQHEQKLFKLEGAELAVSKFFCLLKKHNTSRLLDLPKTTRELLATHYQQIQPYMARINPELGNQIIGALTRDKTWGDTFTYNPVDRVANLLRFEEQLQEVMAKEKVSLEFQMELNLDILEGQHSQATPGFIVPFKGPNVLRIDEEAILNDQSEELEFAEQNGNRVVTNLHEMHLDQAWNLFATYSHQQMKLSDVNNAYLAFIGILQEPGNNGVVAKLKPETLARLGHLYAVFQPYMRDLSATSVGAARDEKVVAALMGKSSVKAAELIAVINPLGPELTTYKQKIDQRAGAVRDVISTITYHENQTKEFVLDPQSARAKYVIKHTEHSQAIRKLHASVATLTDMFRPEIRAQLKPAPTGVPYPDADGFFTSLEVGHQVLALKRLFNCLYYLEQASLQLEELQDNSYEITYAKTVIKAAAHLKNAINMATGIYHDPHFSVIARDLLDTLRTTYDKIQDIREIYTPETVNKEEQYAPKTGMLYALNALRILPEQIKAFRNGEELTKEEMAEMRKKSERAGKDIQRVIEKSNSYFRLFFEIPTVYGLFHELKQQANDLTTGTNEVALENLAEFRNKLSELVMEADQWEDRLGLNPGLLSQPMKEITDQFYRGFLEPLNLPSQQHISLVTDMSALSKRLGIVRQQITDSEKREPELVNKKEVLEHFMFCIQQYKTNATAEDVRPYTQPLLQAYKIAHPILCERQKEFDPDGFPWEPDTSELDDLLNTEQSQAPLSHIERLTKASISYFKGAVQTEQLGRKLATRKVEFLEEQVEAQVEFNRGFVHQYTEDYYQKNVRRIKAHEFGLVHTIDEYRGLLTASLESQHKQIVASAAVSKDIRRKLNLLQERQLADFERMNYQRFYQLEQIHASIAALQVYITEAKKMIQEGKGTFESELTLAPKVALLKEMEAKANDTSKSVQQRIDNVKAIVADPCFETKMLAYRHYEPLTFGWLKQCVMSILEVFGLYTPERQKRLDQIEKAANEPVVGNPSATRYGLFSSKGRAYNLPAEQLNEPEENLEDNPDARPSADPIV